MIAFDYNQLIDELADIAEELDGQEAPCNFSDDCQDVAEFEQDFNLWEDR